MEWTVSDFCRYQIAWIGCVIGIFLNYYSYPECFLHGFITNLTAEHLAKGMNPENNLIGAVYCIRYTFTFHLFAPFRNTNAEGLEYLKVAIT